MPRSIRLLIAVILGLAALLARGAGADEPSGPSVKVAVATERVDVGGDTPGTTRVRFDVAKGYHVYGTNTQGYNAVAIRAKDGPADVASVKFPKPGELKVEYEDKPIPVHEGTFDAEVVLNPKQGAVMGDGTVTLQVEYQACTETTCEDVKKVALPVPIKVVGTKTAATTASAGATGTSPTASEGKADSKFWQIFGVFVAGLLVTLTPCVYPVIPVTISYFQQQAKSRAQATVLALAYGGGIIAMYATLGVVMSLLGKDLGSLLGNVYVGWGFTIFFTILAMSMFGYYDLSLPSSWTTALQSGERGGIGGALFLGLTLSLVAAPCVGPAAGVLMGIIAQSRDIVYGTVAFGSFGFGLALPFMILGVFSGGLSAMPRAGEWMEGVKHVFGYVLLAFSIYYAWVTTGSESIAFALAGVWFLSTGAAAQRTENVLTRGLSIALLAAGLYFLCGPYVLKDDGPLVPPQRLFESKIKWEHDAEAALARGKEEKHPVMLDFTATWCNACHELSLTTFRDPAVLELIEQKKLVPVKVDVTRDEKNQALKTDTYKAYAIPFIAFHDSEGKLFATLPKAGSSGIHTEEVLSILKEIR
jgi:thiol:disulfide interchange protein DsbD